MLTISKALSATQARTYHAREFTSEKQNYWSRDQQGHSEWHGRLTHEWGLQGAVLDEHFARLSEGQHPESAAQLVKPQPSRTYENQYGKQITSTEHRAGWDATFSAPKSVSLTALVGGDGGVREAHRESVRVALHELERYTQARIGNVHAPETTGRFVAATFEHDTARPVDGYAAPQLHTHAVIFNVTERENGQTRALQERSLFQSQRYATSVYRSELAMRLQRLGYEIEHGQPKIKGYTKEYLEASSPRRAQIKEHLQEIGRDGAGAAQVAAHRTRDGKDLLSREEVLQKHRELAARFGHQPDHVVARAREQAQHHAPQPEKAVRQSMTYSRSHVFERSAVQDERAILQAAIDRGMGEATYSQVRQEFEQRITRGEFRRVERADGRAAPQYTTAEMVHLEWQVVDFMQRGNERRFEHSMLVEPYWRIRIEDQHPELSKNMLTVLRRNGEQTTYDPRRQMGVSVYREHEKAFSVGDRVQFTAPNQELKIANRELGTVENIAQDGAMRLKLDGGRSVDLDSRRFPHLDHGYAVTSYSSQGQTAERVLIHADTELGAKDLLNHRMAYVSISRSQWDAQIFTNDREKLSQALSRDVSHQSAYKPEQAIASMSQKISAQHRSMCWSGAWDTDWVCKQNKFSSKEQTMQAINTAYKKPPVRATIPAEGKLLVSRGEAAQLLSISQRGLDYLIANRKLPTRRIGGRVLIPAADLRKYARGDHPENIVA